MGVSLPDPDLFGVSGPKPCEKIDEDEYHSLYEWEQNGD